MVAHLVSPFAFSYIAFGRYVKLTGGGSRLPKTPPTSSGGAFVVRRGVRRRAGRSPQGERPARQLTPHLATNAPPDDVGGVRGGQEPPPGPGMFHVTPERYITDWER